MNNILLGAFRSTCVTTVCPNDNRSIWLLDSVLQPVRVPYDMAQRAHVLCVLRKRARVAHAIRAGALTETLTKVLENSPKSPQSLQFLKVCPGALGTGRPLYRKLVFEQ
jgi:hypothetical protein